MKILKSFLTMAILCLVVTSFGHPSEIGAALGPATLTLVPTSDTDDPSDNPSPLGPGVQSSTASTVTIESAQSCEIHQTSGSSCVKILIDQGHDNYYPLTGSGDVYTGFAAALAAAGYDIDSATSSLITYDDLAPYAAYIIPLAGVPPTTQEIQAMQQYIQNGGGLFLIADHSGTYSEPSQALANVFGVTLDANVVTDPDDYIEESDYWVTYDNANFSSHIVMQALDILQTYASTSMEPGTASPLITTDADADPPNRAIAVALNFGAGRVVILGDSNYFDDEFGLNVGDNKQFGINITNWLARKSSNPPSDLDGDGLLNGIETGGWTNGAGHFTTDPNDADSDDDGLLDGEEKLFDADPNDDTNPGIYVVYGDNLKTKEYFGWSRHGSQYIALSSAIVRRGAAFSVGGPKDATIQVDKSTSSLTTLTPVWDACLGRWDFSIGLDNTVGEYTVTLTKGSWSESLKLYVIFELPTNLDNSDIKAFLYNDDLGDDKDITSIWFTTSEDEYWKWIFWRRHKANGFGLDFKNDQYESYVFTHVMEAINGTSSQETAAQRLAERLDEITRFDPSVPYSTMYDVLHSYEKRNQCSNLANALASLCRSAGIAARPVVVDWDGHVTGSGRFDHATEAWLAGEWKTMRAYNVSQGGEDPPNPIDGGIAPPTDARTWGTNHYPESYSDIIVVADSSWNFSDLSDPDNDDWKKVYTWDNDSPNEIQRQEWVQTRLVPYWGWSSEPTRTGEPSSLTIIAAAGDAALGGTYSDYKVDSNLDGVAESLVVEAGVVITATGNYGLYAELFDSEDNRLTTDTHSYLSSGNHTMTLNFEGSDIFRNRVDGLYHIGFTLWDKDDTVVLDQGIYTTTAYLYTEFLTPTVYFTDFYTDFGLDSGGGSSFDYLVLEAEVDVSSPGYYTIMGALADSADASYSQNASIVGSEVYTYLVEGIQTVQLLFDGRAIFMNGVDGPYEVQELLVTDIENPTPSELSNNLIDYRRQVYSTTAYSYSAFETPGAYFTNQYTDFGIDVDSDGAYEYLAVDVNLDIATSGLYTVTGELYDVTGNLLDSASWSGTTTAAQLQFDGQAIYRNGASGQYYIRNLRLLNSAEEIIASVDEAHVTASYPYTQFSGPAAMLTEVYNDYGEDTDGNSLYDYLVIEVQVNVSEAGEYSIEGWLADKENHLVTWTSSGSSSLSAGVHYLQLRFDGETIYANGVSGVFALSGLKVLGAAGYVVVDEIDVTTPTASYEYTSFEGASSGSGVVFLDDGESGMDNWTADSPWNLTVVDSHSPSHSWADSPGGDYTNNADVSLTSAGIDVSSLANPTLSFWTRYATEAGGDYCYVEVSTDGGGTWVNVATYTGQNTNWTNEQVGLRNFAGITNLRLRFRLVSDDSITYDGWYIDDVRILEGQTIRDYRTYLPLVLRNYVPSQATNHPPNPPTAPSPSDDDTNQSVNINLTWTGGDPDGDNVTYDIYFEADDSTPDALLCNNVTSAFCDPGTLSYGTHYYWYVVATDEHGATTTGPVWDFTTVSQATLTLTSPNGDENWHVGTVHNITWSSTGSIGNVRLEYSKDGLTSDVHTIVASTSNDSSYSWTIPNDPSTTVRVRVSDAYDASTHDASNADWTISNTAPSTPSAPSPADGATGQSIDTNLSWTGGDPDGDSVTYDVYIGQPTTLICNDVSTAACDPGILSYDTHYYWQVIAQDEYGALVTGPLWDFFTAVSPSNVGPLVYSGHTIDDDTSGNSCRPDNHRSLCVRILGQ
ncbi:MAG: hypothetical protein JXR84_11785 [Anaerolineae bacterium]|nr:hypothetical protein [Anaerolineae bacterium]